MARPKRLAPGDGPLLAAGNGHLQPTPAEVPFYIPATGPESRPRRTLKHNDTFAVFDSHGDIGATAGGPDGLFDHDTRFLSHLELLINGTSPLLLGSTIKDNNLNYYVDLTNPDVYADDKIVLAKDTLHIARTIYLHDGAVRERMMVANHGTDPVQISLSMAFASDFADIFEVRGIRRKQRGRAWANVRGAGSVTLSYQGLDGAVRETALTFEPAPTLLKSSVATFSMRLAPGAQKRIFVAASSRPPQPRQSTLSFSAAYLKLSRELKTATRPVASVETSNAVLNEILCRSMADLYMLTTATPDGPYPYAGIPWYSTTFGRDGMITALQMLWVDPAIAAGVLRRLARYQAGSDRAGGDAEPGKILHEMRAGEMAALGEVPFGLYYGSVDATPLFVLLAGRLRRAHRRLRLGPRAVAGDRARARLDRRPRRSRRRRLRRICAQRRDRARQPGLEGLARCDLPRGRQVGRGANRAGGGAGIRLCRQAPRGGLRAASSAWTTARGSWRHKPKRCACASRRPSGASVSAPMRWRWTATRSRARCAQATPAMRLPRASLSPTAPAGSLPACYRRGSSPAGGSARSPQDESRYNPMSYHNGSIWPHDNALIAQGFARYGFKAGINVIFEALMQAASYMDQRRIPELYCGFQRRRGRGPTLYPVACSPQAWAASAPFSLLQSMLGLEFDHGSRQIRLVNPSIPKFAGDITVRNLSLGDASADIGVRLDGEATSLHVMRASGDLQVSLILNSDTLAT